MSVQDKHAWWKEAVIYQIYPRSFADSNGDGIGDLKGVTAHLDYLEKLGIDVIWISPVYRSPDYDNGYDISDYKNIKPVFGSMEDFDEMLAEAHNRGMKVVMDLVVNHTSDEHPWFMESRKSKDNPYRDYYIWREPKDGKEPNNWESAFSGSAWEYDETTDMYYLHCFTKHQPDLNWENPKMRNNIYDMMTWWCEKGIDGFRMDVISMISKVHELPDGPINDGGIYGSMGPYVYNGPHVHEFLKEMNSKVLSRYDLLTVGEAAGVTVEEAKKYASNDGSELGMVFHFEHTDTLVNNTVVGKWTTERPNMKSVRAILNKWQTGLEGKAWGSLYWDNHDQPRAVSKFGNDSPEWRALSAKMLATCLHMMKGTPYVYQGEELGMTNMHFSSIEDCHDIEEINVYDQYVTKYKKVDAETMLACFDLVARDNARTPMQWDDTENAGFSTGTPWIQVNPNYTEINAKDELSDPDSIFYYYQKLIQLRHNNHVIVYGTFEPLMMDNDAVYAYNRILDDKILTVACNWTDIEQPCDLFDKYDKSQEKGEYLTPDFTELISNYKEHKRSILQPYEARVVIATRR